MKFRPVSAAYNDLHLKLLLRNFGGVTGRLFVKRLSVWSFTARIRLISRFFLKYFSSSIISASRYDMTAKQKQLEYQAVTLRQLHETGLQYEARFKKTPPADPFCISVIILNKGVKAYVSSLLTAQTQLFDKPFIGSFIA